MKLEKELSRLGGPEFLEPPRCFPAAALTAEPGVRSLFFEGPPYRGRATRVFAFCGLPEGRSGPVPGVVLVHGGAGTAYPQWVRLWNQRGYAAIAFDHFGCLPVREGAAWQRNPEGGPDYGDCDQVDWPVADQWNYHAVANARLALSLLATLPGVDAERIGLTGISRGAMVASLLAAVEPRLRFVAPVYGCGFISHEGEDGSQWIGRGAPASCLEKWRRLWDPACFLPRARTPLLWISGTNDFAFTPRAWQLSHRCAPGTRHLSLRTEMRHSQAVGAAPEEIAVFANSIVRGGLPILSIAASGQEGRQLWVRYEGEAPLRNALLAYTTDSGPWQDRRWLQTPATACKTSRTVSSLSPEGVSACFLQLVDFRGCLVSSSHWPSESYPARGLYC